MGKPEECAGLLRRGLEPALISVVLGNSTAAVIDYLYRAVGRGYISTSDIILAIPGQFRADIEAAVDQVGTDYWFEIYRTLQQAQDPNRDLLRLYLHIRGSIVGDCYVLIVAIEKSLYSLVKAQGGPDFTYKYFRDLIHATEQSEPLASALAAVIPDPLCTLRRAQELRNRIMHPTPPFSPRDDDFLFLRRLNSALFAALNTSSVARQKREQQSIDFKLKAASEAAIRSSPLALKLADILGDV